MIFTQWIQIYFLRKRMEKVQERVNHYWLLSQQALKRSDWLNHHEWWADWFAQNTEANKILDRIERMKGLK